MSEKQLPIRFRLVNIEEKQFSIFEDVLKLENSIREKVGSGFGINVEQRVIGCGIEYMLLRDDKPFLHIEVVCYFKIEKEDFKHKLIKDGNIILPVGFAKHLATITTGTARGVLYSHTRNTAFRDYFMSLVNIDDILGDKDVALKT